MIPFFKPFRRPPRPRAFISFDVEALPFRAPENPLGTLVWGKTRAGEYGIRRLSGILRQHKLKGNFLVEMAASQLYGDDAVREIADFLLGEGHEVHAHLHPELLADKWLFKRAGIRARGMAGMDRLASESLLKFTASAFQRVAGRPPFLFRSGSYQFNRNTIRAAKSEGFAALSNFNARRHFCLLPFDPVAAKMEPFRWSDGITEMPVDICSPEIAKWEDFLAQTETARGKENEKTCNLVFHSWTLLRRDDLGHHREFAPELEERFHRICGHVASSMDAAGYEEYLAEKTGLPEVSAAPCPAPEPLRLKPSARCRDCGLIFPSSAAPAGGRCPACPSGRLIAIPRRP